MQDVNNQKLGVLEYCAAQKLGMPDMVSDTISGKVDWQQREIGKLPGVSPNTLYAWLRRRRPESIDSHATNHMARRPTVGQSPPYN